MCDTFVIPPSLSQSGHWLFAKNSDREPNEAQDILILPRMQRQGSTVKASFIEVEHPEESAAVILSKPFHLWGAEMGVNEYRVAIGNEAVFTRIRADRRNDGLTGMDMIRLALERCRSAREALDQICHYVEAYGQDACGGYLNRSFYYDNSFLIADPLEAYVLETAGRFWVYKKLSGFYAISNRLTIAEEWDGIKDGAIEFARQKGWCKIGHAFSFADAFSSPLMSHLSRASERRITCESHAGIITAKHKAGIMDAMNILRTHAEGDDFSPERGRMDSLCLHASGLLTPSQTTGSMVAELDSYGGKAVWCTGSSAPCLSLFKPFYPGVPVQEKSISQRPGNKPDSSYWWQWENWHRLALRDYRQARRLWKDMALPLETSWRNQENTTVFSTSDEKQLRSATVVSDSLNVLQEMISALPHTKRNYPGIFYRYHWNKWDRQSGMTT